MPEALRTIVVVPTLLTNHEDIAKLVERLEIHHLASPEGDLHFALLSDWTDADLEHMRRETRALVECARSGIEDLNQRYGSAPAGPRFLLFHRRRVWNESESRWIGWERKRGKLHELNRLLRGAHDTTFVGANAGTPAYPEGVRYVVTLDSDTRLPRDAIRRLIGKMAHPLNQPRVDVERGRGLSKATPFFSLGSRRRFPKAERGRCFSASFRVPAASIPMPSAVSDVYQDMFGEGSYAGKGIYDIDAFETALSGARSELDPVEPRPVRGNIRARRVRFRYRSRRGIPVAI